MIFRLNICFCFVALLRKQIAIYKMKSRNVMKRMECDLILFLCSQVLKVFHYPVTVTVIQFAVGTVLVALMWTFNLYKRPKITGVQVFGFLFYFICLRMQIVILLGLLVDA